MVQHSNHCTTQSVCTVARKATGEGKKKHWMFFPLLPVDALVERAIAQWHSIRSSEQQWLPRVSDSSSFFLPKDFSWRCWGLNPETSVWNTCVLSLSYGPFHKLCWHMKTPFLKQIIGPLRSLIHQQLSPGSQAKFFPFTWLLSMRAEWNFDVQRQDCLWISIAVGRATGWKDYCLYALTCLTSQEHLFGLCVIQNEPIWSDPKGLFWVSYEKLWQEFFLLGTDSGTFCRQSRCLALSYVWSLCRLC